MSMKASMNPPTNNALKIRFAVKFLRAMKKLNKNRPPSPSKYKRYRAIRAAACASMAAAVGPKRVWSRAVLRKTKRHTLHHSHLMNKSQRRRSTRREKVNPRENLGFGQEEDLRCLVPGGRGMGFCSLLTETAHYIKCLKAQVQVMKNILDHFST